MLHALYGVHFVTGMDSRSDERYGVSKVRILISILMIAALATNGGATALTGDAPSKKDDQKFINKAKKLYYYENDRKSRYLNYYHSHPDYAVSKVVWHVDADLDKAFYDNPVAAEKADSATVLVNKQHKLSEDFEPEKLTLVDKSRMAPDAAKAFISMKDAAKKEGVYIYGKSNAYRSYATQKRLNGNTGTKQRPPDASRARAGFSEHQTGLAIDVSNNAGSFQAVTYKSKIGKWLRENSWKYGFIIRYTPGNKPITGYISEPWHARYIGEDHSKKMHEKKYKSFEEYWVKYIAHEAPKEELADETKPEPDPDANPS